jgi:serine/threonine protein kinase
VIPDDAAVARLRGLFAAPDTAGTRYRIVGPLGSGGMASVWEAEDAVLARRVALKVLDAADGTPERIDRLLAEARVLASLEHPGIVPVHDAGLLPDGRAYCAMKKVEGAGLAVAAARLPSSSARLRLFLRICETVAFAHARGVLHRDLKPSNVMVGPFGEVLVMDWGLAAVAGEARETGRVAGTPGYMAPEQAGGEPVDAQTDVFSLGVLLGDLLAVGGGRPGRPLAALVAKATAPGRSARYPDVAALAADVARAVDGEAVSALPEGPFAAGARVLKRHRVALLLVVAYLVVRGLLLLFR